MSVTEVERRAETVFAKEPGDEDDYLVSRGCTAKRLAEVVLKHPDYLINTYGIQHLAKIKGVKTTDIYKDNPDGIFMEVVHEQKTIYMCVWNIFFEEGTTHPNRQRKQIREDAVAQGINPDHVA